MRIAILTSSLKRWLRWDYERNSLNILLGAWTTVLAHPAYYFFCTQLLTTYGYKESAVFRFGSALLSVPLLFQPKIPESGLAWLNLYWYFWITFILPVSFTYILLLNEFAPMWVVCETMMLSLTIIFIGNWVRVVLVITFGTLIGYYCFQWSSGQSINWSQMVASKTYPLWNLLVPLPIAVWCGISFTFGAKQAVVAIEKNEAIKAFAGSIAHEMRNALTQIKFALISIYGLIPEIDNNSQSVSISAAKSDLLLNNITQGINACHRGLQVIDLTLNQVNNNSPDLGGFHYLSAAAVSARALKEYGFSSEEERARVSVHIIKDFLIKVDETAYIYIIFNLIKNATYYFRAYPNARITIMVSEPQVSVTDTGPGICEEIRERLFKPFFTAGKKNGSGLGLSYCYRTMQQFNGTISCESQENQYTTFTLTFPPVTTHEIDQWIAKMTKTIKPFFINKRILLVDDEEIYLKVLNHLLAFLDCEIDQADSGHAALELLSNKTYDLIFMDIQMPGKDGYATCREIRNGAVPAQKNICIIAHTNEPPTVAKLKAEKIGMDGFLSKPCTQVELIREIHKAQECSQQRTFLAEAGDALRDKKVLITDDEFFNRRILGMYAKQWHMQIVEADSGEAALEILAQQPDIDMVFMDINMPGIDGLEATQKIRNNPDLQGLIIIGISGEFSEAAQVAIKAAGMDDFIVKPAEPDVLKKKLLQLMQAKSTIKVSSRKHHNAMPIAGKTVSKPAPPTDQHSELVPLDGQPAFTNNQLSLINDMKLLDEDRLTDYQASFKSDFNEFLEQIIANMQQRNKTLQTAFLEKNYQTVSSILHSLIGVSGYAGAFALNQYIKLQVYPRINEKNYAAEDQWVKTIDSLVQQSVDAMRSQWGK